MSHKQGKDAKELRRSVHESYLTRGLIECCPIFISAEKRRESDAAFLIDGILREEISSGNMGSVVIQPARFVPGSKAARLQSQHADAIVYALYRLPHE